MGERRPPLTLTLMARSLFLLTLLLAACGGGSADRGLEVVDYNAVESPPAPAPESAADGALGAAPARQAALQGTTPDTAATPRHLIRRASLRLRVDDYAEARTEVTGLVGRFGAYVAGEQEQRYPERVENTLTIRVPAARFDGLMEALLAVGDEVDARSVEVEDVTRQYVDLEARLGARRAVAERLTALLARANSVEDVLAVQTQLAQVQEGIEAAEAELRYLRNQVSLSTITLTLFEESATGVLAGPSFLSRLGDAFEAGWNGVKELALATVALWPLWVLVALAVPVARRLERRRKARRVAAT
jgi:hypothetical protein